MFLEVIKIVFMEFMVIFYLFHIIIFILVFVISKKIQIVEKEKIQSILSNVYLDMKTIDYAIKSYKKDIKELTIKSERFMLSLSVYKRIWMYLNNIQYITDNGYFFNNDEEINFFQHDSIRYDVDLRDIEKMTIKGTFLSFTVLILDIFKDIIENSLKFKIICLLIMELLKLFL